jgi:hypothetical protein
MTCGDTGRWRSQTSIGPRAAAAGWGPSWMAGQRHRDRLSTPVINPGSSASWKPGMDHPKPHHPRGLIPVIRGPEIATHPVRGRSV